MKFIIIGLGNFGSALAVRLTSMGHEVIGVDGDRQKIELYKDLITNTICMDVTNEQAITVLPLMECDYAIVTIGEDFGASVKATALLKQAGVGKLVGRAISTIHYTVLEALGVDLILQPEYEAALRFADQVLFTGVRNSYEVAGEYRMIEAELPARYAGLRLGEVDFMKRYSLSLITVIRDEKTRVVFGQNIHERKSLGFPNPETVLQEDDVLLLFGSLRNIEDMLRRPEE